MTNPQPSVTADKWQKRIDREFPNGLLMAWKGSENSESAPHYRIWKISVVDTVGLDPVVELKVFDVPKTFVGQITSYNVTQDKPLMAEVVVDGFSKPMIWSANISPRLAELMKTGPDAV